VCSAHSEHACVSSTGLADDSRQSRHQLKRMVEVRALDRALGTLRQQVLFLVLHLVRPVRACDAHTHRASHRAAYSGVRGAWWAGG